MKTEMQEKPVWLIWALVRMRFIDERKKYMAKIFSKTKEVTTFSDLFIFIPKVESMMQ
jgi:hypothetical protein